LASNISKAFELRYCGENMIQGTAIMSPTEFTPLQSLIGGAMIGLAAVIYMFTHGRIAGISGIAVRMFPPYLDRGAAGRIAFVLGLVAAPALYAWITGAWAHITVSDNLGPLIIAGVLTGFGAVLANGCTSGHGVCGLARLSVRSLVAVGVFMCVAVMTVYFTRAHI
jgi:uncharacterized protein